MMVVTNQLNHWDSPGTHGEGRGLVQVGPRHGAEDPDGRGFLPEAGASDDEGRHRVTRLWWSTWFSIDDHRTTMEKPEENHGKIGKLWKTMEKTGGTCRFLWDLMGFTLWFHQSHGWKITELNEGWKIGKSKG